MANRIREFDQGVSVRNCHILGPANGRVLRWADGRILGRAEWTISITGGCLSRDGETCKTELAEGSCSVGSGSVVNSFGRRECQGYGAESLSQKAIARGMVA